MKNQCAVEIHDFASVLENGIPGRLTFARVLQIIQLKAFAVLFSQIMAWIEVVSKEQVVAIDVKALAGTYHNEGRKGLIYMVSAWCSENKISLAQVNTQTKSNEINAIPELLDLLDIKGAIVTMDAMGCQKKYEMYRTIEKEYGLIEERRYYLFRNLDWFKEKKQWIGLSGLLMTESRRMDIKKILIPQLKFVFISRAPKAVCTKSLKHLDLTGELKIICTVH